MASAMVRTLSHLPEALPPCAARRARSRSRRSPSWRSAVAVAPTTASRWSAEKIDATAIDRDPLAVLPSGAVMLGYLDAAAMFTSGLGGEVNQIVTSLLPLGPESNFVPSRDIVKVYGGLYAMQGADFAP